MPLDESFTSEIDAAVEQIMADVDGETTAEKTETKDEPQITHWNQEEEDKARREEEISEDQVEDSGDTEVSEEETTEVDDETKPEEKFIPTYTHPPQISDEALTRAVQCGMTVQEARGFLSEQSLATACELVERQREQYQTRDEQEEDPLSAIDKLDPNDPEGFEPEAVQLLKLLAGQIRTQRDELQQLRSGQEQSLQANQVAARREVEDRFDKQIESLGDDFQKSLGVGSYRSLTPGSQELARRDAIAQRMAVTMAGYNAMGRQLPPFEEVFHEAAAIVLADEFAAIKEGKVQKDLKQMSKTHIQRAKVQGSKVKQQLSPEEEAAAVLKEKYGI